jgi:hypothetical protein
MAGPDTEILPGRTHAGSGGGCGGRDPDTAKKAAQLCDANLFIGEFRLLSGAKDEAVLRFQAAAKSCYQPELAAAKAELKALGKSP